MATWQLKHSTPGAVNLTIELSANAVFDGLFCYNLCQIKIEDCLLPFNLLKPTGDMMHQQFNIQQLYALPTLYLCVLYLSENKQRLVPLTA